MVYQKMGLKGTVRNNYMPTHLRTKRNQRSLRGRLESSMRKMLWFPTDEKREA